MKAEAVDNTVPSTEEINKLALRAEFALRKFDPSQKPLRAPPLYCFDGVGFATSGNISVITALPGAGKTGLVGSMLAAAMVEPDSAVDTMGITAYNPAKQGVIFLDTEQSKEDFWDATHRALRRAGLDQTPYWIRAYHLRGMPREKILSWLPDYMDQAAEECQGIHSVLTDGYSELISDLNDQAECIRAVAQLMAWAEEYSCHFSGILHLNPDGAKSRGHFGSEISRRCETEFTLHRAKIEDVMHGPTRIIQRKARRQWIVGTPTYDWSEEKQMHVRVAPPAKKEKQDRVAIARAAAEEAFGSSRALLRKELVARIVSAKSVTSDSADNTIGTWAKLGVIRKTLLRGQWEMTPQAAGGQASNTHD